LSFGRKVHSRTVSLTATLTSRPRNDPPEWLLRVRRYAGNPRELGLPETDVENSAAETAPASVLGISVTSRNGDMELATQSLGGASGSIMLSDVSRGRISPEINQVRYTNNIYSIATFAQASTGQGRVRQPRYRCSTDEHAGIGWSAVQDRPLPFA